MRLPYLVFVPGACPVCQLGKSLSSSFYEVGAMDGTHLKSSEFNSLHVYADSGN
jgi:hypothetical protein